MSLYHGAVNLNNLAWRFVGPGPVGDSRQIVPTSVHSGVGLLVVRPSQYIGEPRKLFKSWTYLITRLIYLSYLHLGFRPSAIHRRSNSQVRFVGCWYLRLGHFQLLPENHKSAINLISSIFLWLQTYDYVNIFQPVPFCILACFGIFVVPKRATEHGMKISVRDDWRPNLANGRID